MNSVLLKKLYFIEIKKKTNSISPINFFLCFIDIFNFTFFKLTANVLRLALSGVEPTPSHYKYNKTFHSVADFP